MLGKINLERIELPFNLELLLFVNMRALLPIKRLEVKI